MSYKSNAKTALILLLYLAHIPGLATAQDNKERRGWGYAFFAPGAVSSEYGSTAMLHIGGGGEGLIYKGLGAGAEIGYAAPAQAFGAGIGLFSANGSYHFVKPQSSQKAVPFVTGGFSLGFRESAAGGMNVGGGVNYWLRNRLGLRFECRTHFSPTAFGEGHLWQFRIGIVGR
jgi:hypothetical protein